jgi:hypothetical protein
MKVISKKNSSNSIELVGWRSGQVVFLPLSWPESTGSILLIAANEDPISPHTTKNKEETLQWVPLSLNFIAVLVLLNNPQTPGKLDVTRGSKCSDS